MELIKKDVLDFKMFLDTEDVGICKTIIDEGIHEKYSADYIKSILRPDMNVLDIGANIGYYVFIEASVVSHVYAVEPVIHNFNLLTKNIALNKFQNITTYPLAIGGYNGITDIYTSFGSNWAHIVPDNERLEENSLKENLYKKGVQKVPLYTLDNFIKSIGLEKIDLVRMDLEGAEVGVIAGGISTLNKMPKDSFLSIEVHSVFKDNKEKLGTMFDQIESSGFICERVTHGNVAEAEYSMEELRKSFISGDAWGQCHFKKH